MNKHDSRNPRAFKGHPYRVVVDGFAVAEFSSLKPLTIAQVYSARDDYAQRLIIPSQRITVEAS